MNPFGSSKDRAVKMIIREAEKEGKFDQKKEII
jgi:cysteine synthase